MAADCNLQHQIEQSAGQEQTQREHDSYGTIACCRYKRVVGQQGVAAVSFAGVAVAIDDALFVDLGSGEAAALERAVSRASAVANEALVAQFVNWADLAICMILECAARIGRVAGALQTLGTVLGENQTVAALVR